MKKQRKAFLPFILSMILAVTIITPAFASSKDYEITDHINPDMSAAQVADALDCEWDYSDAAENLTSYKNSSKGITVSASYGEEDYPGGVWQVSTKKKTVSIYGIKTGMNFEDADEELADSGWSVRNTINRTDGSTMVYYEKGEYQILIVESNSSVSSVDLFH